MDQQLLINSLHAVFSSEPVVALAYLFGSQVDGLLGPMSDIDLGLVLEYDQEIEQARAHLTHKVSKALEGLSLDLVLPQQAPIELAYAAIAEGLPVYLRDLATRVEFEAHVLSRYGDYLPVLRNQRPDILQGLEDGRRVQRYREALRRTERMLGEIASADR